MIIVGYWWSVLFNRIGYKLGLRAGCRSNFWTSPTLQFFFFWGGTKTILRCAKQFIVVFCVHFEEPPVIKGWNAGGINSQQRRIIWYLENHLHDNAAKNSSVPPRVLHEFTTAAMWRVGCSSAGGGGGSAEFTGWEHPDNKSPQQLSPQQLSPQQESQSPQQEYLQKNQHGSPTRVCSVPLFLERIDVGMPPMLRFDCGDNSSGALGCCCDLLGHESWLHPPFRPSKASLVKDTAADSAGQMVDSGVVPGT